MRIGLIKVRVDIEVDRTALGPHGGTRYMLNKWVFDGRTGATLDHAIGCNRGMTLKDARARKREILEEYRG